MFIISGCCLLLLGDAPKHIYLLCGAILVEEQQPGIRKITSPQNHLFLLMIKKKKK